VSEVFRVTGWDPQIAPIASQHPQALVDSAIGKVDAKRGLVDRLPLRWARSEPGCRSASLSGIRTAVPSGSRTSLVPGTQPAIIIGSAGARLKIALDEAGLGNLEEWWHDVRVGVVHHPGVAGSRHNRPDPGLFAKDVIEDEEGVLIVRTLLERIWSPDLENRGPGSPLAHSPLAGRGSSASPAGYRAGRQHQPSG
jgi:hypothetical protein